MSCLHIQGTRREVSGCPPFKFTSPKDRTAQVAANARSTNPKIRAAAASSPFLTEELASELMHDPAEEVREWLARNEWLPASVLAVLSRDSSSRVRAYVAWNPNITFIELNSFLKDSDPNVRALARIVIDNDKGRT